ncbi:MAG: molybdopterin-dependent oxidoreductase [Planctomycetaceae bacterium]
MPSRPILEDHLSRRRWLSMAATGAAVGLLDQKWGIAAQQPAAQKQLIVHGAVPQNAEPALSDLVRSWETPVRHFYVRSHAPVPKVDLDTFRLTVEGMVEQELSLSMTELIERFPTTEVTATMTCAGNRRNEHSRFKKVGGVQWAAGPIGNARWGGVRLADVLRRAGLKTGAKHVWFESIDQVEKNDQTFPFGASIPLEKGLEQTKLGNGTLLATSMNGDPLPPDHGFPVRTVVPGYVGARSVKWLGRIVVSDRPSDNHYVAGAYKLVTDGDRDEWAAAQPIYTFPVNSAICVPGVDARVPAGMLTVHGYALPSGQSGRTIDRVEISTDGGKIWQPADVISPAREYCWCLWTAQVPVHSMTKQLIIRAIDSSDAVQPQSVDWNLKGYLYNAWYRTPIQVDA